MKSLAVGYFYLQGFAGLGWWSAMAVWPEVRMWFEGDGGGILFGLFPLADLLLFAGGSLLAARALSRNFSAALPLCWTVTGAVLYATLICLQGAFAGELATLCAVLMIPAAMLSVHVTLIASGQAARLFRVHATESPSSAFRLALLQTLVFYLIFFAALPLLILRAQNELGLPRFALPVWAQALCIAAFLIAAGCALTCTAGFARIGRGTPLPTRSPRFLVTSGPYAVVRNPMAVCGIFQGIMVGCLLGSFPVILYSLTGAVMWHIWVRPVEEADLSRRFGPEYEAYRKRVTCWIPTFNPQR
jgi:protein-S-isoprenylcysteine O-methyltransferase Ste14